MTATTDPWQKILQSRPRLAAETQIYIHTYRQLDWYLLVNPVSNQQVLIDRVAYQLLRQLTDRATVSDVLDRIATDTGKALGSDDLTPLFARLLDAGMLDGDMTPSAEALQERHSLLISQRRLRQWLMPLSIKLPLIDPDAFLARLALLPRLVFNKWGAFLFMALLAAAAGISFNHWPALQQHWTARFQDPQNLLWLPVLYVLVKAMHEVGHGLAARHWGAEIHEMGIMLLIFFPVPYVDATTTSTFHSAKQRMTVAAAGILIELLLASVAIIGWFYTSPSLLNDMLFNIAVIGGVSTLFFNGNPLLRYDGYYVLSDILQIPNLGSRSSAYVRHLFATYVLGLDSTTPLTTRSEAIWLAVYGILSGTYRFALSFIIALYIVGRFFFLGIALAIWFVIYQILRPLAQSLNRTVPVAKSQHKLGRLVIVMMLLLTVIPAMLFVVPAPHSTSAYGIILPPQPSLLRVTQDGFMKGSTKLNGDIVHAGEVLFQLTDEELLFTERKLLARQDELNAQFRGALTLDRVEAERLKQEITAVNTQLDHLRVEIQGLTISSQMAGKFSDLTNAAASGKYAHKGDLLGFVTQADSWTVTVMVPQAAIDLIRYNTAEIEAMSLGKPSRKILATIESETPLATDYLPSRSLGTLGGGYIAVDARDPEGLRLVAPMFKVEVKLPAGNYLVGQTILVRFLHSKEPVGYRLTQNIQQLLAVATFH